MAKRSSNTSKDARTQVQNFFQMTDQFHAQLGALSTSLAPIDVTATATLGALPEGDIEALAFLVLMQAAQSAQEDLKAIMQGVKAISQEKKKLRRLLETRADAADSREYQGKNDALDFESLLQLALVLYGKQMEEELEDVLRSDLDSLSEMGEMESLRLQLAMDRMSKMMSMLSNLLKKLADTQSEIVQNLK